MCLHYLADSSLLFAELGADHLLGIKILLPNPFALGLFLNHLCGFLQNRRRRFFYSSSAPTSNRTSRVGGNVLISARQLHAFDILVEFGFGFQLEETTTRIREILF